MFKTILVFILVRANVIIFIFTLFIYNSWYDYLFFAITRLPRFLQIPHPVYPEVSIIPKDGGARSDGHSDAATKSAPVRLQTGPTEERGERPCCASSSAAGEKRTEARPAAEARLRRALAGDRCRLCGADGEKESDAEDRRLWACADGGIVPVLFCFNVLKSRRLPVICSF